MRRLKGLYILDEETRDLVYGPEERRSIADLVDVVAPPQTKSTIATATHLLKDVDVIFSGWGMPTVDRAFLDAAPNLRAIFYAGGGAAHVATPEAVARGVMVTTAIYANSIPVAEYTLATILFSLKRGWSLSRQTRERHHFPDRNDAPGCYGSTVGLISLGNCGRILVELLRMFDLRVLAHDPHVPASTTKRMGVEPVSLEEVFRRADVVSVHAPHTAETTGLITGLHLASMPRGATFINTARGGIVREQEMIDVLTRRPDLQAVLDVTCPEPPTATSPLYTLPNVVLTPHLAGSVGRECRRMGRYMVEELEQYVNGERLEWAITPVNSAPRLEVTLRPVGDVRPAAAASAAPMAV